jgi:hypothetical protein
MITFKALTAGVRSTNKSYRMIALLYAINFLIAGILAWGFHSVLARTIGDSMSLERLVRDFDYTVFTDFMFKYGGRITALFSQLSWLIFFYLMLNTLLGGGTIAVLKNEEEKQFSLRSFFENCGAFFFRFLRLFLIFGAILFIVGFIASAALGLIYSAFASNAVSEVWPFTFAIILILLFLFIVMLTVMMADYAKVATVANDARSMLKTSWQGIKFVLRHFLSTVGLQLSIILFLLVSIVVYLLLENQIGMATPIAILVMFVIQQVSVGFKVWTRVLTFAGELELFEEFREATELPKPIPAAVPAQPSMPVLAPEEQTPSVVKNQPEKRKRVTRRPPTRKAPAARRRTPRKAK